MSEEGFVGRAPVVARCGAVVHVWGGGQVAGGYGAHLAERALKGDGVEVPLAGDVGVVACFAECLPPDRGADRLVVGVAAVGAEAGEAGVEHGAAGDADRAGPSSLMEAVGEVAAGADELIEVRGLDFGVVDGVDGAEHEVVRDYEEEVGALVGGSQRERAGGVLLHSGEGDRGA